MKNTETIKLNSNIYPIDVIFSAAYVMLDKAYFKIDEDSEKNIIVSVKTKEKSFDEIQNEFMNELINYKCYKDESSKNKDIVNAMVQRALVTNDPTLLDGFNEEELDEETKKLLEEIESNDDDWLDDPEGIAIPWEEKYGNKNE